MADERVMGAGSVDTLDFVDQKSAREVVRLAQQERAILAALPDLIFELSPEGVHVGFHAPRMESLYVPPADLLGRSIHEVLPPEVAAIYQAAIDRTLATEKMQVFEYRLAFPGPQVRVYEARMVWKTADEVLAVVRDVTARHELEEKLRQAQKMDAIGQLAGGIAHDFNNLLTVINGFTAMALDQETSADTRELLTEVARAGERAANLTRQLLMFSRDQVFEPRPVNLNMVIAETERMLRRLIGEDVELMTALEEIPSIFIDPGQVEQVLVNLCLNARDAMTPGGGRLTISTGSRIVAPLAEGDGPPPGAYVVLTVADTGIGMSDAVRTRIFEPFFTTKAPGTGTGLGLAVVFGAVRQAGGFIEVDSAVGRGTTLRVHLPANTQMAPSSVDLPEGLPVARGDETILVVEDDPSVRSLATRIMSRCGYRVIEAMNGRDAIETLAGLDGPLDLILTDVVMPEVNGRELAEAAAQLRPEAGIVFMSGYTDDEVFLRGVLSAEVAFVMKPFTAEALTTRVRQELDARKSRNPETNAP